MSSNKSSQTIEVEDTSEINVFPYDNDVTLMYKWAEVFQVPINLIIVRPRGTNDSNIKSGTQKYVYESLLNMIERLERDNNTPSEIYDIINQYNKFITIDDIAMVYYFIWNKNLPPEEKKNINIYVNNLYELLGDTSITNHFEDVEAVKAKYESWNVILKKNFNIDMERLRVIETVQNVLAEEVNNPKLLFSPITINTSIVGFSPTIDGKRVNSKDGLDIFNKAIPSKYVPFIKYNDEYGKSYYRIYTGGKLENEPNYSSIVTPSSSSSHKNAIYLTLWLGDPNSDGSVDLTTAPKESFYTVIYELSTNFLTIKTPIIEKENPQKKGLITDPTIGYKRTQDALPNLNFGEGEEVKVGGEFNIWDLDFDETSFLDMVLLDPVMNVYLYVEENIKPFAVKKRLDVYYRSIFVDQAEGGSQNDKPYIENSASVSITISQRIAGPGEMIKIIDKETSTISEQKIPDDTEYKYIHVNISQADSTAVLEEFIPVFQLLMGYYRNKKDDIKNVYFTILPQLNQLEKLLTEKKKKNPEEKEELSETKKPINRKLERAHRKLYEKAPDIFVHGYPRVCQSNLQPISLEPEEIEEWKKNNLLPSGYERQVMPFPKFEDRIFLGCPKDKAPYPGVKVNKTLPNKDIYPYIPCCGKKDQMSPGLKSTYNEYLEGDIKSVEVGAKAENKITTNRILTPGKIGFLPKAIENLVKKYSPEYTDMVRYGVIYSPNSMLHCICEAVDDPNYISLGSNIEKENYVINLRNYIRYNIHPGLLKQELYDYNDDDIINALEEFNSFFDPAIFYRAIEEIFNVNIYVFLSSQSGNEAELGTLDIPRFKIFHSRPIRINRRTILIIKSWGSKSYNLDYPQCELIMDYNKEQSHAIKIFGSSMTQLCHDTLSNIYKTTTWTPKKDREFQINSNIYYYIDHVNLFKVPIISQYIDNNGKMRALTLNVNDKLLTIATLPSQPENIANMKQFETVSFDDAVSFLGEPVAISQNSKGEYDGLWFKILDIEYGEYVPINPISNNGELPIGPRNPIISTGVQITNRLTKLRKTLNIIIQLMRFLYELVRTTEGYDIKTFVDKYFVMDQNFNGDSANYYDLEKISRKLPDVQNVEKAINVLSTVAPTLFNQGKIIMYNAQFTDRIVKLLQDYSNINFGLPFKQIEYINNYYETEQDFNQYSFSKIFTDEKDFNAWLSTLKSSQNYSRFFGIHNKIDLNLLTNTDPYLYMDSNGKIYIIQNVIGGKKQKAINVAVYWLNHEINIGPDPNILENEFPYMLYGISSSSSTLSPIEDVTGDSERYINLIYYGTIMDKKSGKENKYGAMLEIL